jgi:hypothetical protein
MQEKEPQPRDPDIIIIDIPNIFYFQQEYSDLDEYKNYNNNPTIIFMSSKKELDLQLLLKLQKDSLITIPSILFKALRKQEIENLITKKIFSF